MRKLFFSLVATLAFGSFAMANIVDVETVEAVSVSFIENQENDIKLNSFFEFSSLFSEDEDCDAVYRRVRDGLIAAGATHQQAVQQATVAFSECANPEYHK